jgi:transposase-like protein
MYLYGAVDEQGQTIESYLSRTRDIAAVETFFRKALKHHGERAPLRSTALSGATQHCA